MAKVKNKFDYSSILKNPKWQKRRLEIMQRDNFTCQCCFNKDEELTVHHKYYISGVKPWDYSDSCYVTLCGSCHNNFHEYFQKEQRKPYYSLTNKINNSYTVTETDAFLFENYMDNVVDLYGNSGFKSMSDMALSMIIKEEDF